MSALEYGRDYTVQDKTITLTTAGNSADTICIYRETPTDRQVEFVDASVLKAYDLNKFEIQLLHIAEENYDSISTNIIRVNETSNVWDGLFRRLSNIADPTEEQDVVTKHYMENVQTGFVQTNREIQSAINATALATEGYKNNAALSASNAHNSELLAKTSENSAAISANNSSVSATNAKTSEANASNSAAQSLSSANVASQMANNAAVSASNIAQHEVNTAANSELAHKWADYNASPDNNSDASSPTSRTQSARTWALYAKQQAENAAADSARVQSMTLTNIDSIVDSGTYVAPSPNPDDAAISANDINSVMT